MPNESGSQDASTSQNPAAMQTDPPELKPNVTSILGKRKAGGTRELAPNSEQPEEKPDPQMLKDEELVKLAVKELDYEQEATELNGGTDVLFADPERSNKDETYWITGEAYKTYYEKTHGGSAPSCEHMDHVPSIIRNRHGNYFPKASLPYNLDLSGKPTSKVRNAVAEEMLQENGLTGDTYSGLVKFGKSFELPADKRMKLTSTGERPQQREFRHPKHAGIENRNYLLFRADGVIYSFDIGLDDKRANLPVADLEAQLKGTLALKSIRSNGYHTVDYLSTRVNKQAAQERHASLTGAGRNTNRDLPQVAVLLKGNLVDIKVVWKLAESNPTLVNALRNGTRGVAPLVRILSPNGGYWTPEFAMKESKGKFEATMRNAGIDPAIGEHKFSWDQQLKHRKALPRVLVDTGYGLLKNNEEVRRTLGANETIASKYPSSRILVANRSDRNAHPTGFYTQLHEALKNNKAHPQALKYIHRDADGQARPELASPELLAAQEQAKLSKATRPADKYDGRFRGRNTSRASI